MGWAQNYPENSPDENGSYALTKTQADCVQNEYYNIQITLEGSTQGGVKVNIGTGMDSFWTYEVYGNGQHQMGTTQAGPQNYHYVYIRPVDNNGNQTSVGGFNGKVTLLRVIEFQGTTDMISYGTGGTPGVHNDSGWKYFGGWEYRTTEDTTLPNNYWELCGTNHGPVGNGATFYNQTQVGYTGSCEAVCNYFGHAYCWGRYGGVAGSCNQTAGFVASSCADNFDPSWSSQCLCSDEEQPEDTSTERMTHGIKIYGPGGLTGDADDGTDLRVDITDRLTKLVYARDGSNNSGYMDKDYGYIFTYDGGLGDMYVFDKWYDAVAIPIMEDDWTWGVNGFFSCVARATRDGSPYAPDGPSYSGHTCRMIPNYEGYDQVIWCNPGIWTSSWTGHTRSSKMDSNMYLYLYK